VSFFCIFKNFNIFFVFKMVFLKDKNNYWDLFLEPLGRPRFLGSEGDLIWVSLGLFLEPLGRPRFLGSEGCSIRVSLGLFLEPLGRPLFLGASSWRGKMRSWILTSRASGVPCAAIASAGTWATRSVIRSAISMTLDIIWK